ncbi:ribonuclease E/G [Marinovum sp. 2_MG-2023]|uniref:ribonuclease E/G n=1 Tax=unclassified Marinovum TaxID=2647166 RepID=UPI0026E35A8D|nr:MULTISPECIES: ribonuclease E/G [unclassified Marinovum]MDO6728606.1 ribonuclease E/G [Marinovum sp. 2_MG-2023]MDO6777978.1 ribonuclease E/G [Marinovum sp. 1_MG-2023]
MKGRMIVLDSYEGREAAALIVDGRLEDLLIDGTAVRPGAIYRAKADRPMKGQGGMFLSTPDGAVFLRQVKGLKPGEPLLVQVTGHAESGKAVPVTQKLLFKSRYAIATPGAPGLNISRQIRDEDTRDALLELAHEAMPDRDMGLILRSSCAEADAEDIAEDILAVLDLARSVLADATGEPEKLTEGDGPHVLAWREWVEPADVETEPGGFERLGVLDQIDALAGDSVALRGAGHMYVETTRALVAVDVNTGGDTSPAAGLKANLAAMRDLPRQLRLRGLGGQIVIDMAPMAKKDRRVVETELRRGLKTDSVETTLVGWTNLGHYELQRARVRNPLAEIR